MSTITTSSPPADQPAVELRAELRAAAREQAALIRLTAAVVTMRAWRQLGPPPTHPAAHQGSARHHTGRER